MLPLVKHHALYFLFELLFISMVISPAVGSFDTVDEDICEGEDAMLTWQIPSAHNVESKLLYKGRTLVASWLKGHGFIIYSPYENRLLQIGESAIKIKNATRSDSGTYKLFLSRISMTNTSEALTDLHVMVAPTDDCITIITREEDTLRAKVPESECGIPCLIPYWINASQKHVNDNMSVLQPESRYQPRTYTACPVGKALKCFMGSPEKLCANDTLDALHSQNGSSSVPVVSIIVPVILVIAVIAIGLMLWKFVYSRKKHCTTGESHAMVHNPNEETPLTENEISVTAKGESHAMVYNPSEETPLTENETSVTATGESHAMVHNPNEETPLTENEISATDLTETMMTDVATSVQEKIAAATKVTVKFTFEIPAKDTVKALTKLQEISPMQQKQGSNDSKGDNEEIKGRRVKAKYPQFSTVKSRLDSFDTWPSNSHLQPEELAEAGLFYQGDRDCVICFFCGGKLSQWEPTDTAWAEHEKNYPKCEYVKLHKKNDSSLQRIHETEGHEDIQSRKDPNEEEQCISNETEPVGPQNSPKQAAQIADNQGEQMKRESKNVQLLCKTCQKELACIIFIPCSHFVSCYACAYKLLNCSDCQQEIRGRVKAYCS